MNTLRPALAAALLLAASTALRADYPVGYYDALVGKNKGELKSAARGAVGSATIIGYGDPTWTAFRTTDRRTVDGTDYWWDMYSPQLVPIASGHPGMNIEHSVANSWWDGAKNAAYNDLHHLNPSDSEANSRKSNYPLGVVGTVKWTNGVTTVGYPAASSDCGGASWVYEPCDEYKGDFARVFFYMFTRYEDMQWGSRFTWMYTQGEKYPMLRPWAYTLLLQWAAQDPVSEKERDRNEAVYAIQHNRNPFIDLPTLADYIWGASRDLPFTLTGEPAEPSLTSPAEGASLDFGRRYSGTEAVMTLDVKGAALTTPLSLAIEGSDRFSVSPAYLTAAQAVAGTTVSVTYAATDTGTHAATLLIAGGGLSAPRAVALTGATSDHTGLRPLVALPPVSVTQTSYRARWEEAPAQPDYYKVNRTYMVNGTLKTRHYMTTDPWYDFADRDFTQDERYTVQYSLGGELSPESNEILLRSGDLGASALPSDAFEVECVRGGVRVVCGGASSLTVTDISGRTVLTVADVAAGRLFPLAPGLYILHSPALRRPLKIAVD